MARINLLPWRVWERKKRQQEFIGQLLAGVLVAALAVLVLGFWYDFRVSNQQARNKFLDDGIATLDKQIEEIQDLKDRREQLLARMRVIQELQGNRPIIVRVFDELARTLATGVFYDSVKMEGNSLSISGSAEANNRVSALMRGLDGSDWFADPNLKGIKENPTYGPQASSFQLTVKQVNPLQKSAATE